MKRPRHADRLSALPDKALECILSSLASDEATRTSVLSRRWRRVCAAVPIVDLADPKEGNRDTSSEKLLPVCFNQKVTGAILGKAPGTPLRTFRLDAFHPPHDLLDQWILTATCSGAEDIDVKLRYWHDNERSPCPFGSSKNASQDLDGNETSSYVKTQHRLFRCSTLRRLRLTNWTLDLPQLHVVVSSLETLCLSRIVDPNRLLPQLLSNCPRLADLTLQECPSIKEISVESPHLRSFTMICCHHANRIKLHGSCLRSLHYKGGLPTDTLFEVENYQGVAALTIEICEDLSNRESTEVAPVTALITRFTKLTYLHLSLRPSMAYHCGLFADAVRRLPLRQLHLHGCFLNDHAVRSIAVLLRDTQNLEVLSLFLLDPKPQEKRSFCISDDESDTEPKDDNNGDRVHHSCRLTSSLRQMYIRCLGHKLRRINIVNYTGQKLEKILAHFLISRGSTLEKFSVTSAVGSSRQKDQMARELRSWRSNRHTRVTVN